MFEVNLKLAAVKVVELGLLLRSCFSFLRYD
jgi:hypothetical protein